MAFEAYRQSRRSFFSLEESNPWTYKQPYGALFVIDRLVETKTLIKSLEQLDTLFPDLHHARILNVDGKGTTQWLLFYPNKEPDAPLVCVATSQLRGKKGQKHFSLYDRTADALVVKDCNINYFLDTVIGRGDGIQETGKIPRLSKTVDSLEDLAAFLATKPRPPPLSPPVGTGPGSCMIM
jgi:hypothetical protein